MGLGTQNVSSASSLFANLNLSATQNTQVQGILQNAQGESFTQVQSQLNSVLSPTQQSTLQGDLQKAKGGHHHHHGGGGASASASSGISDTTDALGVSTADASDPDADAIASLFGISTGTSSANAAANQVTNPFSSIASTFAIQSQLQQYAQL